MLDGHMQSADREYATAIASAAGWHALACHVVISGGAALCRTMRETRTLRGILAMTSQAHLDMDLPEPLHTLTALAAMPV